MTGRFMGCLCVRAGGKRTEQRGLSCLVLGDTVVGVLLAGLALAVGAASLGNVDPSEIDR